MKKRVVFVSYVYEKGGGTEKHLEDLIVRLDFSKVDPVILCFGPDVYTERINQKYGLRVEIHKVPKGETFLSYWRPFVRLRPHAIVFVNGNLGCFPWYAYVAARCSGAWRVFAIEHLIADPFLWPRRPGKGLLYELRRSIGWRARQGVWKFRMEGILCDRVICVSQAVNDRVVNDYDFPEHKTVTIRNGVDLSHYGSHRNGNGKKERASAELPVVLCVARLSEPKGIGILLNAMVKVLRESPFCKCVIVGDGPDRDELVAMAKILAISQAVQFAGHIDEVRPYYELGDIFVLSSLREGLPLVLLEAMTYGLPCIATDVGGSAEVIMRGETGLVVEPRNPEELAKAILELLADPELRRKMGQNGKKRVEKYFDIDNSMARISQILLS